MARIGTVSAALLVALVVAATSSTTMVDATERNGRNMHCMPECYTECLQIRIFNEGECKKDCALSCARYAIKKALREEDDTKFFPSWI
ncbi:hypothetical protein C2S53_014980 [Perilla frutescens var. hirtella]|uniref:Uncharacterized protein n=1 Tax=Perilla frutescens var. hirtella TaxID=608512 RepID=A0AAD4ITS3_PERFH|nr:hypothetical protein C2S53_014980 [Perilla frutescens var. hirtella]